MKVGVNIAIIQDGQILLTKREDFEVWCLPGGHVDEGESVAQAAVREVAEETGLAVKLTRLVGIYSIPEAQAWVNLIILFVGEPIGGTLQAQASEVIDMAFFQLDEIPKHLLWGHRQRIVDAADENVCNVVRLQHVPFGPIANRQELYKIRDESGLSRIEFYQRNFGWDDTEEDRPEII